jgi:chemotaxis signal transduction protein
MPLVRLGEVLGGGAPAAPTTLHVIVYDFREASVGVVVDSIIDIVSERVELQPSHETPGVRQGKRIRYRLAT